MFKIIDQILIKKLSKSWYTGAGLNRAAGTSSLIFENLVSVIASQQAHIKVGDLLPRRKPIKLYTCHGDYFWKICKINGLILVMQLMRRKKNQNLGTIVLTGRLSPALVHHYIWAYLLFVSLWSSC